MLEKFRKALLLIIILLCAFQFSYWGVFEPVYGYIRILIIIITIMLFITIDIRKIIQIIKLNKAIRTHFLLSFLFLVFCFYYFAFGLYINFSVARDLFVICGVLIISASFNYTDKQISNIFFYYSTFFLISILSIVFFAGQGLQVLDLYMPIPKNQLAPAYAMGALICFYSIFNDNKRKKIYIVYFSLYIVAILVLRSRSTILATFTALFLILFFELRDRKIMQVFTLLLFGVLLVVGFDFIYDSLFKNIDTSDINSVSSGRMERNIKGYEFLRENLILGESRGVTYGDGIIHNYILKNIVAYGIFAALPLIILYFTYLINIYK